MILLNDKPIKYKEYGVVYNLNFFATTYNCDNSLAIICETDTEELFATVTVNLSDYGMVPGKGIVYISHDLLDDFKKLVIDTLSKEVFNIHYGMAKSIGIKLKDEIFKKIEENGRCNYGKDLCKY